MSSFSARLSALILPLALVACASTPPTPSAPAPAEPKVVPHGLEPVPAGELRRPASYSLLAVLLPDGAAPDAIVSAIAAAAARLERAITNDSAELASGAVLVDALPVESILSFEVIDFDSLGFSPADASKIKQTKVALSMVVAGPAEALALVQRQAADIARAAIAAAPGAWLFDGGTFQVFSAERFSELRPQGFPLEVERLITVMVDDSSPSVRLETLGMERLGLPELRMFDVPRPLLDGAVALFNAAAQLLVEQGSLERPGQLVVDLGQARMPHLRQVHEEAKLAGGGSPVALAAFWDPTERGQDADPVIRLDLPTALGDRQAAFSALLTQLFGRDEGGPSPN